MVSAAVEDAVKREEEVKQPLLKAEQEQRAVEEESESEVEGESESDDPDRLWCICHQPHDDRSARRRRKGRSLEYLSPSQVHDLLRSV